MIMKTFRTGSSQQGVTLLEALLGILLFSVGILAVVGIQAMAVRNVAESKYRMDASFLANQVIGEMWTNRSNLALYNYMAGAPPAVLTNWVASVNSNLPGSVANPPTVNINGTTVTVTIFWQAPEEAKLNPPPTPHSHRVISVVECC
jgi:type IV pilus assembly protein PilV